MNNRTTNNDKYIIYIYVRIPEKNQNIPSLISDLMVNKNNDDLFYLCCLMMNKIGSL